MHRCLLSTVLLPFIILAADKKKSEPSPLLSLERIYGKSEFSSKGYSLRWVESGLFVSLEDSLGSADALVMPSDGVWNHPLLALVRPELVLNRLVSGDRRPLHLQFAEMPHSILLEDAAMLRNVNQPEDLE